jgi:uncharacterized protein (DUF983 family)
MSKEPNALSALLNLKCPQCRKGNLFTYSAYSGKHAVMPEKCPNCGLKYEIETGFYWGAMYIAYALISAIFIGFLIIYLITELKWYEIAAAYVFTVILLIPLIVRYSRALMLYTFGSVKYMGHLKEEKDTN